MDSNFKLDPLIAGVKPMGHSVDYLTLRAELIAENGPREPLVVWEERNILLDGYVRYEICQEFNIPFDVVYQSLPNRTSALRWVRLRREMQFIDEAWHTYLFSRPLIKTDGLIMMLARKSKGDQRTEAARTKLNANIASVMRSLFQYDDVRSNIYAGMGRIKYGSTVNVNPYKISRSFSKNRPTDTLGECFDLFIDRLDDLDIAAGRLCRRVGQEVFKSVVHNHILRLRKFVMLHREMNYGRGDDATGEAGGESASCVERQEGSGADPSGSRIGEGQQEGDTRSTT